jgi:hypothetical protein
VARRASTDRQFEQADAAATRAVTTFVSAIDRMMGRWEDVAPQDILEHVLLLLCDELTKRIDRDCLSPLDDATLKLSNALADYRDSRWEERD